MSMGFTEPRFLWGGEQLDFGQILGSLSIACIELKFQ